MHRKPHHPLETGIGHLADLIETQDNAEAMSIWASAALASKLGLVAILVPGGDPEEAIVEAGEMWVAMVLEHLEDEPDRREETLWAALRVVEPLLERERHDGAGHQAHSPTRRLPV